jgi:hypothetical protein
MNTGIKILIITILGIIFTIIAPLLFIQEWTNISFRDTGQIGDTIGGTTAPIIGILSIILLIYTLLEQIKFNQKQKEISTDEQFKSTFFNLLQVQRDILEKISGKFTYLDFMTYKENSWKKGKIEITKKGKEFLTINNGDEEVKGLDFFKAARFQLALIFQALDNEKYFNNYNGEEAFDKEMELQSTIISSSNMPPEIEKEQDERIQNTKIPFKLAYINDKYEISKFAFDEYKKISAGKKIGLAYAFFFNKYEGVGYYFRHIYHILKFIKQNEDEKIESLGKKITDIEKNKIHSQFRQYAQFIQAQMSTDELLLLFYDSFTFEKAQKLIIHYDLLENLTIQNLIKKEHNCKSELKMKDKTNLFLDMIKK